MVISFRVFVTEMCLRKKLSKITKWRRRAAQLRRYSRYVESIAETLTNRQSRVARVGTKFLFSKISFICHFLITMSIFKQSSFDIVHPNRRASVSKFHAPISICSQFSVGDAERASVLTISCRRGRPMNL